MNGSRKTSLAFAVLALAAVPAAAQQERMPQVSPLATVTQRVGISDVTITYSRPGVKGRKVWGELVPHGKTWRTGANAATTITFGEDVLVQGKALAAGTYALFTVPGEKEWTLVFSKNAKQWGEYNHKESDEALRVSATPRPGRDEEWMSFRFDDLTNTKATVVLAWEKLEVPFTVQNKVDTNTRVLATLKEKISKRKPAEWEPLTEAASYAIENNVALDDAAKWLDESLKVKDTTFTRYVKARHYEKQGKLKEGVAELERAVAVAGPDDDKAFVTEIKSMIVAWKKKAA
jgi:hypothetical protein